MHKKHEQPGRGKNNASFDSNYGYGDKAGYDNTASNDKTEYAGERSQLEATKPPSNAIQVESANFYME